MHVASNSKWIEEYFVELIVFIVYFKTIEIISSWIKFFPLLNLMHLQENIFLKNLKVYSFKYIDRT